MPPSPWLNISNGNTGFLGSPGGGFPAVFFVLSPPSLEFLSGGQCSANLVFRKAGIFVNAVVAPIEVSLMNQSGRY